MQTYTHLVMAHLFNRKADAAGVLPPPAPRLTLLGSVAPDLPLIAISLLFMGRDRLDRATGERSRTRRLYETLFFNDWRIKLAHNLFHAPLLAIGFACVGYGVWRCGYRWGAALFWFALAALVHTAIDIPLHHDDGPLLLFPIDWERRYVSRFSYWDPQHYGKPLALIEHSLLLLCLLKLRRTKRGGRRV